MHSCSFHDVLCDAVNASAQKQLIFYVCVVFPAFNRFHSILPFLCLVWLHIPSSSSSRGVSTVWNGTQQATIGYCISEPTGLMSCAGRCVWSVLVLPGSKSSYHWTADLFWPQQISQIFHFICSQVNFIQDGILHLLDTNTRVCYWKL